MTWWHQSDLPLYAQDAQWAALRRSIDQARFQERERGPAAESAMRAAEVLAAAAARLLGAARHHRHRRRRRGAER